MIPAVLSGGSGTRLWPVSRASFPKQFNLLLDESLLLKTLRRLQPLGEPRVIAVRGSEHLTGTTLEQAGIAPDRALYEPSARNTAPAVALLCRQLELEGRRDEIVGIFPADHLIADQAAFEAAVEIAARCASEGPVVTLGIRPTEPATGYGYIEVSDQLLVGEPPLAAYRSLGFREKPDRQTAEDFLAAGRFFWNAGMFVFRADTMIAAFERFMPELWSGLRRLRSDLGNLAEVYGDLPSESLDYGIMEKLEELATVPCGIGWSDLGSWDEVARVRSSGENVVEVEGEGNFVFPHGSRVYGLAGVSDLRIVDTADALLITRRGATQGVKEVVRQLAAAGRSEAHQHAFEERPWGSFEILRDSDRFKSKILRVAPGQRLSYQSHRHRSEHWVIVQGTPRIVLDGEILAPSAGEAVFIPQGAKHRIENPGAEVVEIVEVQIGSYFGEDDIVRYEDDYDRD
ncbi:MAG: mannose-1-phosphate guanylyltransferase/mannose-6-phosphate isomerase [Acidobacteriota bacterium]